MEEDGKREKFKRQHEWGTGGSLPTPPPVPGVKKFLGMSAPGFRFTVWLSYSAWGTPWQPLINSTSTFGVHNPLADMVVLREASFPALSLNPSLFAFVRRARQYLSSLLLKREPLDFCNRYLGLNSLDPKSWCAVARQCLWGPFHLRSSRGYQNEGHRWPGWGRLEPEVPPQH